MKSLCVEIVCLFLTAASAQASMQVRVVDGDTMEVAGVKYRLHGIDAPEAGQSCKRANGETWACGKEAISLLEKLALGQDVVCDDRGKDLYGRTLGVCTVGTKDLNAAMVEAGNAWAFRKYSMDYAALEDAAHRAKIGIWQAETETPWDFRVAKWKVAQQQAPDGCPIKGNISKGGHIYHAPWSPWYMKTKIDVKKGERWFCSEQEAVEAGWRAPFWGH